MSDPQNVNDREDYHERGTVAASIGFGAWLRRECNMSITQFNGQHRDTRAIIVKRWQSHLGLRLADGATEGVEDGLPRRPSWLTWLMGLALILVMWWLAYGVMEWADGGAK